MSIYKRAVQKPITTALIFVAIAIIGLFSYTRLSVELMPDIQTTDIIVITSYKGASAEDIELNVTKLLENSLNSVDKLKHITSKSSENVSLITLSFNAGADIAEATNEVRDKLDAVRNYLPEGVENPIIFKFGMKDIPVAMLTVESKESASGLNKILDTKVVNSLARIDGVGSVNLMGASQRTIQVYCEQSKLQAYGLTLGQIAQAIARDNRNIPAGSISVGSKNSSLRIQGEFSSVEDIRDVVLYAEGGKHIYLRDVCRIVDGAEEKQQESYTNGRKGALIMVKKQSGANAVAVSEEIARQLPMIQKELPKDIKVNYLIDTSDFIVNTLNNLGQTIAITFIIVMLIVYIFLVRYSATFIIVLTIPVSLIGAFIYLMMSGNSLNIISLSSLSIAIGMVVDDAIVVLENISSHISRGSLPKQAAVHATNEVGLSVVASTLTMLAVFLPLTMVTGSIGLLFRQLGWIVSIVMIISTVAALSLTPMLSSVMLKRERKERKKSLFIRKFHQFLDTLDSYYCRSLAWCLGHRKVTILISLLLFASSLLLLPLIKTEYMKQGDNSFLSVEVELPVGVQLDEARDFGLKLDRELRAEIEEIRIVSMSLGQASANNMMAMVRGSGTNIINFYFGLLPPSERDLDQKAVADKIRSFLKKYPEIVKSKVSNGGGDPNANGSDVLINLYGYDFQKTQELANGLTNKFKEIPACAEIVNSRKDYMPEYQFVFDRDKLADKGLSLSVAGQQLKNAVNGMVVSRYREDGQEYDIRLSLLPEDRTNLEDVLKIQIASPYGYQVNLSKLGHLEASSTPPTIDRRDRSRVLSLGLSLKSGYALSDLAKEVEAIMEKESLPQDMSYSIGGTYEQKKESFRDLSLLFVLIILLVFIIMAAQFESLSVPMVIMFSVPFAVTGVFLGLLLTQIALGSMAFVGLIMLVGIVVKNGIVLIDYIQLCRERGQSISRAILNSGRSRLRPVLMTTLTTVLGMLPMSLGLGEGGAIWQSMGVALASGLSFSTLITLFLIPTIYASVEGFRIKKNRKLRTL